MINRMERERELYLIKEASKDCASAFNELLDAHMPVIHMLAGRLQTSVDLHEELTQAGRIGFMGALRKYRPEKDTRLITYAVPWITGEMKRVLRSYESQRANSVSYDSLDSCSKGLIQRDKFTFDSVIGRIDLRASFSRLNGEEQRLLMLRYFRGKTQKETALLLNRSQAQISKTERKILDELRGQLE